MDKKTRLAKAFNLETPDRPPILGGWLAAPGHIRTLTGCSEDDYWSNPFGWGLEAERVLGSDGVITIHEPVSRGEYRIVDGRVLEERARYTVEGVLAEIETMPDPEELESRFDKEQAYKQFVAEFKARQAQCGDLLWCPADWNIVPQALWYGKFGYESALMTLALYPDRYRKLIQVSGVQGYQRAVLLARAMREGLAPLAFLTGEDLCGQRGPMVSPDYLRREYFPLVRRNFEPLLQAGARIIWHCDGDWRPLLDDVFDLGIGGLQGFQGECGLDLSWLVDLRTRAGEPLIILGPLSVTTTLPHGTPDDVRAEVQRAMQLCRGKASLVFFTSNTINPDVPLENIRAFWQTVQASAW